MTTNENTVIVTDNVEMHRFEARVGGQVAGFVVYRQVGGSLVLVHTEVADQFEGKGVGGQLARGVLDQIRARGLKAQVICPFIASFVERHPEYGDLVVAN